MTVPTAADKFRPDDLDRITAQARSAGLYRWFVLGYTEVHCTPLHLRVSGKRPPALDLAIDETTPRIALKRGWLWCRLTVHTAGGRSILIGGLDRQGAAAIDQAVAAARADLAAARRKAEEVGPGLIELAEEASRLFDGSRYLRHSMAAPLLPRIQRACRRCRAALVRHQLDDRSAAALKVLEDTGTKKRPFEASRKAAIARFIASAKAQVLQAADGVVSHPPTDEQAAAIATDEDVTQVLAGAGAGKTAAITCKVAHLVRNQGVPPWQILVLAFNRKAADEIRERLPPDLDHVEVRTFHSFGRQVIADVEPSPEVSPLAKNDALLRKTIRDWLFELPEEVAEYGAYFANEYRSPFDFETLRQYTDFVRSCDLRALSGEPTEGPAGARPGGPRGQESARRHLSVDSLDDLLVANFLALHGVRFDYKANLRPNDPKTLNPEYQRYEAAFRLPTRYGGPYVYIETFFLYGRGRVPGYFPNYEARVAWKRKAHARAGTHLIEVHGWQCAEHTQGRVRGSRHPTRLEEHLYEELPWEALVVPEEVAWSGSITTKADVPGRLDDLLHTVLSGLPDLLATFLKHVRGADLSPRDLRRRADASETPDRNRAFLHIFEQIRERYEKELAARRTLDWNDMIVRGARFIEDGRWRPPHRYILVDEFQDISAGRMRLLKALKGEGVAFFLVGDDWQSINRFAGSDVRLFQECERHLGKVATCNLSRTFRYGKSILEPTSAFVQKNRAQTQRQLRSASSGPDHGITVVWAKKPKKESRRSGDGAGGGPPIAGGIRNRDSQGDLDSLGVIEALDDIEVAAIQDGRQGPKPSVLVLGRYRNGESRLPARKGFSLTSAPSTAPRVGRRTTPSS